MCCACAMVFYSFAILRNSFAMSCYCGAVVSNSPGNKGPLRVWHSVVALPVQLMSLATQSPLER